MRTLTATLTIALAFAPAGPAADNEARAIVDRAIRSQGGAEALGRLLVCKRTDHGKQVVGDREESLVSEVSFSLPDKARLEIELGRRYRTTIVVNGEVGYQSENRGPAVKMPSNRVQEVREELYLWYLTALVPLTKDGFTLTTLAEATIDGEPAVGVKVEHKDHADAKLYFRKRNGLLVQVQRRVKYAGLTIDKEYDLAGYKRIGQAILPTRLTEKHNKVKWAELTIGDYRFPEKLDASLFARP